MNKEFQNKPLLLSGNEAVALGASHGGVNVASAYPGTPSTEILETIARRAPEINAEWAPNEKVALEVGMGAAFTGARVLVTMKHVGVNVAADPLFTLSYTGTKGGIVLVSADDPGMHSSQNEQDNRNYGPFAKVPVLEPADSQEAYDFMRLGLDLSEQFDTPVILRMTTRVCHSKSIVHPTKPVSLEREYTFESDQKKYVMLPAYARARHAIVEKRTKKLREWAESTKINHHYKVEGAKIGIITSGVAFQYVREIMPHASILKIGMLHPLPSKMLTDFATQYKTVYVVEELEPFIENHLLQLGIDIKSKPELMRQGELTPDRIRTIFGLPATQLPDASTVPPRPPVLCPGCPHRAVFTILKKLKLKVMGDIGCYTLGALPPLQMLDTCVCMGAGINHAMGMSKILPKEQRKKNVAVIGDSTFVHSGITGLINMVYNGGDCTVLILDNRTTAMTGRQDHPGTGKTLMGTDAPNLDLAQVCRAIGVPFVKTVSPWSLEHSEETIREAIAFDGPAVVIEKGPCILINRKKEIIPFKIDTNACKNCGACARTGCPAIEPIDGAYKINPEKCRACELCYQLCKFGAIASADA